MWIAFAVLVFFLGALYQKNQMLQGGTGILGVGSSNVSPTVAAQQQAAQPTFKPFDYKKETGTYFGPFLHKQQARIVCQFLIRTFRLFLCNKKKSVSQTKRRGQGRSE